MGGFIGLYAQVAPVEVRVRDAALCAAHTDQDLLHRQRRRIRLPLEVFPGSPHRPTRTAALCMECLRTCPYDNIAINLRPFGADLSTSGHRGLDEAFKAILMLGSGLAYTAVLLGPWNQARAAAAAVGSSAWLIYALGFLLFVVVLVPAVFLLAARLGVWWSRSRTSPVQALRALSPALVPVGLSIWAAFSLSFLLANLSYVGPVLSDPLNLGWNLLGTAGVGWSPYGSSLFPWLTIGVLVAGLAWSSQRLRATSHDLGGGAARPSLPGRQLCADGRRPVGARLMKAESGARLAVGLVAIGLPLGLLGAWKASHTSASVTLHARMSEDGGWIARSRARSRPGSRWR